MGNEQGRVLSPEEVRSRNNLNVIDGELKQKLNTRSVKYNLKLVIKGDVNTGKSSLFHRLQGLPFSAEYRATPEIQISHINWNYKNTDDIVDVEVWDVVDVAKRSAKKESGLVISNGQQKSTKTGETQEEDEEDLDSFYNDFDPKRMGINEVKKSGSVKFQSLDAQTMNVYKNANAVIFMIDPSKRWTFNYVENEMRKVSSEIFVLLITNYRDKNPLGIGKGSVTKADIDSLVDQRGGDRVFHIEASMLNAYGLRSIVNFFNIPFLYAQRVSLQRQLERNQLEINSASEEVGLMIKEQSYDYFVKFLDMKRSGQNPPPPVSQKPSPQVSLQTVQSPSTQSPQPVQPQSQPRQAPPAQPIPQLQQQQQQGGGFFSRLFGQSPQPVQTPSQPSKQQEQQQQQHQEQQHQTPVQRREIAKMPEKLTSVDEFVINDASAFEAEDDFYDDKPKTVASKVEFLKSLVSNKPSTPAIPYDSSKFGSDSDDDDTNANPLVSQINYSDDEFNNLKKPVTKTPLKPAASKAKPSTTTKKEIKKPSKSEYVGFGDDSDDDNPFVTKDKDYDEEEIKPKTPVKSKSVETPKPTAQKTSPSVKPSKSSNDTTKVNISSSPAKPSPLKSSTGDVKKPIESIKTPSKSEYVGFSEEDESDGENPFVTKDQDLSSDDEKPITKPVVTASPKIKTPTSSSLKSSNEISKISLSSSPAKPSALKSSTGDVKKPSESIKTPSKSEYVGFGEEDESDDGNPFVTKDQDLSSDDEKPITKSVVTASPKIKNTPSSSLKSSKEISKISLSSSPSKNSPTLKSSNEISKFGFSSSPAKPSALKSSTGDVKKPIEAIKTPSKSEYVGFGEEDESDDENPFVTKDQDLSSDDEKPITKPVVTASPKIKTPTTSSLKSSSEISKISLSSSPAKTSPTLKPSSDISKVGLSSSPAKSSLKSSNEIGKAGLSSSPKSSAQPKTIEIKKSTPTLATKRSEHMSFGSDEEDSSEEEEQQFSVYVPPKSQPLSTPSKSTDDSIPPPPETETIDDEWFD